MNSKEVTDRTSFLGTGLDEMQLLNDMDTDYSNNYECLMLIDSNMLYDNIEESPVRPNHWINYKGGLSIDTTNNKIIFKLFTWGQGDGKQYTIKKAVFEKHFYGYIKAKIV